MMYSIIGNHALLLMGEDRPSCLDEPCGVWADLEFGQVIAPPAEQNQVSGRLLNMIM